LKNGVRPTGVNITPGLARNSALLTSLQQGKAVGGISDCILRHALDEYTLLLVFTDHKGLSVVTVHQQVKQFLVVDLKKRAVDCEI
jgi:hypothetical protein